MKMDKSELRRVLPENMCKVAEDISILYRTTKANLDIHWERRECPEAFHAGVADKAMFLKIIDSVIDNVAEKYKQDKIANIASNHYWVGLRIMITYYYPQYGEWVKMPLMEELEKRCPIDLLE